MRRGVLTRRFVVRDPHGRRTRVAQRRFVSMADALRCRAGLDLRRRELVRPTGGAGRVGRLGGQPRCGPVHRPRRDAPAGDRHGRLRRRRRSPWTWRPSSRGCASASPPGTGCLPTARCGRRRGGPWAPPTTSARRCCWTCSEGEPVTVEKVVVLCTSRDRAIGDPAETARRRIATLPEMDDAGRRHVLAWDHLWERCYVEIDAPLEVARGLNLHLFHLLQTRQPAQHRPRRGHPGPRAERGGLPGPHLLGRHLRVPVPEPADARAGPCAAALPLAPAAAGPRGGPRGRGSPGAMFPWQSGSDGREETPPWHLNPKSGRWLPDNSRLQRHIGLAIAYNVWAYYEATGDLDFLAQHGAELHARDRQVLVEPGHLRPRRRPLRHPRCDGAGRVPRRLPGRDEPGIDNNTYTNVMVVWTLHARAQLPGAAPRPPAPGAARPARRSAARTSSGGGTSR